MTPDVFNTSTIDNTIVEEYYRRNERKKEDEKWLNKHKTYIREVMAKLAKDKTDVGEYRVAVSVPDESHFDLAKLCDWLWANGFKALTKAVVDEDAFNKAMDEGAISQELLAEITQTAWVEKKGTPRIVIKRLSDREGDA